MKTKNKITIYIFLFIVSFGFSQEKTKKQLKEERKIEVQRQVEIIVNSKEFNFVAKSVSPLGHKTIFLNGNSDTVAFSPEMIKSALPYYGRVYSGSSYGGDGGMNFEGVPIDYSLVKEKKYFLLKSSVKGSNDVYNLTLTIYFEGGASLMITCNNRSSITYDGEISKTAIK